MDLDLAGRTALVTGSTRGIGFATAVGLGEMGARVVLHGRMPDSAAKAAERAGARVPGATFEAAAGDLGSAEGCDAVAAAHPDVDILVNNLGIYDFGPFEETDDAAWLHFFQVNVMSGVRMARHYLAGMRARNWGRVVFVSSESGVFVPPDMILYGTTKATQLAVSRGLAETTAGTAVTVNAVLPGPTWVETQESVMTRRAAEQGITVEEAKQKTFSERRPTSLLKRYTTPDEVANMICYVCSPAASATSRAALRAEGGIVRSIL